MSRRSIKQALSRLTRQKYVLSTSEALVNELNTATDRTFAIIESGLVEDALGAVIARSFSTLPQTDIARLFDDPGPLSTFANKILMGCAINVIDKTQRFDLALIRELRNAFAHAIVGLSFVDKAISDACMLLKLADVSRLPLHQRTPRWRFTLSCSILQLQLSGQITNAYLGPINIRDLIATDPT